MFPAAAAAVVSRRQAPAVSRRPAAASLGRNRAAALRWPLFRPLVSASSASPTRGGLVLYTKKGCCLCDGLKEKLEAAFLLGGPHSLGGVQLQVRDIAGDPEWEQRYRYEVPVLARVLPDGSEEVLPRLSPRLGVELIQKKISSALGN